MEFTNKLKKQNKIFFINTLISWIFGVIVFLIGIINIFWGNDKYFGVFILMLSFIYLPPTNIYLNQKTKFILSKKLKFFLGVFILWASLGVGELFDKISIMIADLQKF